MLRTCLALLIAIAHLNLILVSSLPTPSHQSHVNYTTPRPAPIWPPPSESEGPNLLATNDHNNATTQRPPIASPEPRRGIFHLGDLIVSDQEFQRLLDRLRAEAEEDVRSDPRNYVPEEVDAEEIMRMFATNYTSVTTTAPETPTTVSTTRDSLAELAQNVLRETIEGLVTGSPAAQSVDLSDANYQTQQPISPSSTTTITSTEETTESPLSAECAICLQALSDSKVEVLECFHKFHLHCIDQWTMYQRNPTCPLCRTPTQHKPLSSRFLWQVGQH